MAHRPPRPRQRVVAGPAARPYVSAIHTLVHEGGPRVGVDDRPIPDSILLRVDVSATVASLPPELAGAWIGGAC